MFENFPFVGRLKSTLASSRVLRLSNFKLVNEIFFISPLKLELKSNSVGFDPLIKSEDNSLELLIFP